MGIGVAFAGAVVSVLLGVGASHAHAAEGEERSVTGAVAGLIGDTASLVDSTVSAMTSTAVDTVSTVVDIVPAPVQKPVQAVGQVVDTAVTTVTTPVQQVVDAGVVSAVTAPVVEVVTKVPVVGDVVSGLGVDDAVTTVGERVDDTLATTVHAVTDTGAALAPRPSDPALEEPATSIGTTDASASSVLHADVAHADVAHADGVAAPADRFAWHAASVAVLPSTESFGVTASPAESSALGDEPVFPVFTGDPCLTTLSSGPAGAGSGAWALAALLPFAAHRAWVRRAGPGDDDTPPAPTDLTDASPD